MVVIRKFHFLSVTLEPGAKIIIWRSRIPKMKTLDHACAQHGDTQESCRAHVEVWHAAGDGEEEAHMVWEPRQTHIAG